ncbi:hypothetical protein G7Y89_g6132 [Cudoniella acicularis]|uniref:Exonuclease domain-containing protein n=1 Tax=Cudoniella acicularis TaxID=354080 RepID=A0A8H4RL27_9HELO|nr:hypothetical protein G7Y89_g6132 [Cudoniella acicularis]
MFTSKGLFSAIECPHQDTCILPRCIFGHPKGLLFKGESSVRDGVSAPIQGDDDQGDQESRRKRQKLDDRASTIGSGTFISEKASTSGVGQAIRDSSRSANLSQLPGENDRPKPSSLTRAISPPPTRKNPQIGFTTAFKQTPSQSSNVDSRKPSQNLTPIPVKAASETKTPVKAPLKTESLNPRPLKNPAPATHQMRFMLLRALHDQFKRLNSELEKDANDAEEKLVLKEQALISKALDVEEDAASGASSIYSNIVKNKILAYKRMTVGQWKEEREKDITKAKAVKVEALSTTPVSKPNGPPKPLETGLKTEEELALLPRLYTPLTSLSKHGYVTSIPTAEEIELAKKGIEAAKGWEICDRCKSRFQVFPERREEDGALASGGQCTYHFGKPYWPDRSADDPKAKREKRYRCCGQVMGDSAGCTIGDCHVFKISEGKRLAAVFNFEETPENPDNNSSNPVCIDGEMGYTVHGLELIRLTATSWPSGDELFDILVRPIGHILDLNTRYSGVSPKDMAEALPYSPSLKPQKSTKDSTSKQKTTNCHGLENDLNAIRLIHRTIIDTALLFPHKAGLPYRNGLKMLMYTHLNRHIQVVVDGKMEGHDSKEDANAAGMLVRWRIKEEWGRMKRDGWMLEDGMFKPPKGGQGLERVSGVLGEGAGRKRSREEDRGINHG